MKKQIPVIRTYFLAAVFALSIGVGATGHAATPAQKLSLPGSEMTVGQLLSAIETQTGHIAAYDNTAFDTNRRISLPSSDISLEDALKAMLRGSGFTYLIRDEYIAITPGEVRQAPARPINTSPAITTKDQYRPSRFEDLARVEPRKLLPPPQVVIVDTTNVAPDEVRSEDLPEFTSRDLSIRSYAVKPLPVVTLKTNLLHAATLTPNLGMDIGLGKKTSLELFAAYNPWKREGTLENNKKIAHLVLRPEFRWWFCERLNGHFLGVNAFYWQYNIGGHNVPLFKFKKDERYEGHAVGAAVTYGYHLPLHKRWGLEFSISAGAAYMDHDIYDCAVCSGASGSDSRWYFGPTNASVSLVFVIR